ncbi:MAG: hypothetical protein ABWY23_04335 [Mycetocola sp.]
MQNGAQLDARVQECDRADDGHADFEKQERSGEGSLVKDDLATAAEAMPEPRSAQRWNGNVHWFFSPE